MYGPGKGVDYKKTARRGQGTENDDADSNEPGSSNSRKSRPMK